MVGLRIQYRALSLIQKWKVCIDFCLDQNMNVFLENTEKISDVR